MYFVKALAQTCVLLRLNCRNPLLSGARTEAFAVLPSHGRQLRGSFSCVVVLTLLNLFPCPFSVPTFSSFQNESF